MRARSISSHVAAVRAPCALLLTGCTPHASGAQQKLIDFDKATYGVEWLPKEKRNFAFTGGAHFAFFLFMVRFNCTTSPMRTRHARNTCSARRIACTHAPRPRAPHAAESHRTAKHSCCG
jgi:hypothetical protein